MAFLVRSHGPSQGRFAVSSRFGLLLDGAIFERMCGRVRLSSDVSEIKLVFSIPPGRPTPNMRWGLVPFLAKDIKVGFSIINTKAGGIEGKPAFREAFQRRRCLIPVE